MLAGVYKMGSPSKTRKMKKQTLLDHDHSEMDSLLSDFFPALEARDLPRCLVVLDLFWARLAVHIRAEHVHLFPAVLDACHSVQPPARPPTPPAEAQEAINALRHEHDFFMTEIWRTLKLLRALPETASREESAEALGAIRQKAEIIAQRLHAHNEREEGGVYRWAEALLDERAGAALASKMQVELENMPPRFSH